MRQQKETERSNACTAQSQSQTAAWGLTIALADTAVATPFASLARMYAACIIVLAAFVSIFDVHSKRAFTRHVVSLSVELVVDGVLALPPTSLLVNPLHHPRSPRSSRQRRQQRLQWRMRLPQA